MLAAFWLISILLIAIGVMGGYVLYQESEEQRPGRLLRFAEARGLGFSEEGEKWLTHWHQQSPLFRIGHYQNIKNVVYGPFRDLDLVAFDHHVQHEGQWHHQTVITFELKKQGIPRFNLWPKQQLLEPPILEPDEDAVPLQINHPESRIKLNDHYVLYTPSEGTTRMLLCPKAVEYLVAHPDYRIEGGGSRIAIYQFDHQIKISRFYEALRDAYQILRVLRLNDPKLDFESTLSAETTDAPESANLANPAQQASP